jgi:methyl-accepting chemotaxis protein
MTSKWTFGRTLAAGFAIGLAMNLAAGLIALVGMHSVVTSKDKVINVDVQLVVMSQQLLTARADRAAGLRGYLFTRDTAFRDDALTASALFQTLIDKTQAAVHTAQGRQLIARISAANADALKSQSELLDLMATNPTNAAALAAFTGAAPTRIALKGALTDFSNYEGQLAKQGVTHSTDIANRDLRLTLTALIGTVLSAALVTAFIARNLKQRIGSAVGEVQNSSTELQTTANQQAVGAMEQATAMSEISTTINELLVSSRQITESAQRVASVADLTSIAGRSGRDTVASAQQSMTEIRRQVDVIVNHMLELGDKSQRIGSVLDIVSELAEQTNILAINSTIEAAGAGEAGKRFAVVADEIRKLADRVAQSTKEIRNLIEIVRGAVHTTVMATEIGSKAVDAGTAQFAGVASSFEEISGLASSTTEAAREIELSTKQQSTAVEQVNFAVANVTQTTKESETNSTQTLATASQLTELSTKLLQLVEPAASR